MEIQETHNRIRDRLAYLSATVKGASAMGQTDIHRLSETVICPVLKIILDLPDLRNLNSDERDFPGIDLGDPTAGVGIQVTVRANASKIRKTIRTCIRHDVYRTYPRLRVFVLTDKQSAYRLDPEADLEGKLVVDPQVA
ncbi:MAG: SMEK domain-containing protein, partial [Chloroflexota bacterium]|nr:SMEK domain-containing protein [Chloroflexota bacterium]